MAKAVKFIQVTLEVLAEGGNDGDWHEALCKAIHEADYKPLEEIAPEVVNLQANVIIGSFTDNDLEDI